MVICYYTYVSNKQPWRFEFLERSLPTFLATDFPPNTHIIIADDCSSDERVKPMLCSIKTPKNCKVEFIFRKTNLTCDPQMTKTMRFGFSQTNDQYLVTCDADVIYNPAWIRKLIEAKESIGGNIKIAMVTCFDTKSHKKIGDFNDLLIEKKDLGGFCAFVNRDLICNKHLAIPAWDWSCCELAKASGYRFFCTRKSWVDHLGRGKSGHGKSWDVASNFVGMDYVDKERPVDTNQRY